MEAGRDSVNGLSFGVSLGLIILGALLDHLLNRYRSRFRRVRWSVQYVRLAIAGTDPLLGTVQVLYNNVPVTNLHIATVQVENQSNYDLRDIVINFGLLDGSRFIVSYGLLTGGFQYFPYGAGFAQVLNDNDPTHAAQRFEYITKRRDFQIPVLNRWAMANFALLIRRDDAAQPNILVTCEHPGVQFVYEPIAPMFPMVMWGIRLSRSIVITGLAIGILMTALLAEYVTSTWIVGFGAWLIGISVTIIGIMVSKTLRWILRLLG